MTESIHMNILALGLWNVLLNVGWKLDEEESSCKLLFVVPLWLWDEAWRLDTELKFSSAGCKGLILLGRELSRGLCRDGSPFR